MLPTAHPRLVLIVVVAAAALGAGNPGLAATAAEVREFAREATAARDVQSTLPWKPREVGERYPRERVEDARAATTHTAQGPPTAATTPNRHSRRGSRDPSSADPEPESGDDGQREFVIRVLLAGALIAGLFFAVRHLRARARRARAGRPERVPAKPPLPEEERATATHGNDSKTDLGPGAFPILAEADRVARDGDYGEGVHLVLEQAISILRNELRVELPRSLTSREVRRRFRLDEGTDRALGELVNATEVSLFGGRPASEADYRRCREQFLRHLAQRHSGPVTAG